MFLVHPGKKNRINRIMKNNLFISFSFHWFSPAIYVLPDCFYHILSQSSGIFIYLVGWRRGISPPRSHGSERDSLPSFGSYHPAARLTQRFYLISWLLPSLVDQTIRPDDPTPSLHSHYRNFNTTTSWSAPVPRIGTLILVVSST
jgi:hypothetical protein